MNRNHLFQLCSGEQKHFLSAFITYDTPFTARRRSCGSRSQEEEMCGTWDPPFSPGRATYKWKLADTQDGKNLDSWVTTLDKIAQTSGTSAQKVDKSILSMPRQWDFSVSISNITLTKQKQLVAVAKRPQYCNNVGENSGGEMKREEKGGGRIPYTYKTASCKTLKSN